MLRFMDGADHYDTAHLTDKWTTGVNAAVIPGGGRFGGNCIQVGPITGGGRLLKTLDAQGSWIIGFAFYTGSFPTTNCILVQLLDSGTTQVELRLNNDGTLSVTRNGAVLSSGTSTFALSTATWHYIEWKVTIAAAISADTCIVHVDNAQVIDVATGQNTQNTANPTANAIQFAGASPQSSFDDLYIADDNGGTIVDFVGDSRIITLLPNGAGDSTQFTVVNAGNNWAAEANNPPLDDGQYVYSATPGQVDLYNLVDPTITGPVYGIQVSALARKDDAGTRQLATQIKTGGNSYTGTTRNLSTSYLFYSSIYELNPQTTIAWTGGDLIALQAGVNLIA